LVNGTDANDLPLNAPQVILSPDAIGEVNLITNTINPEYGRNGGAILNATTKSGTNGFHGDAFDFYRDTGLNTRNFFSTNKTIFHQHQFGGTIGGPIKKDKAFFFFSYQGTRTRQPESTTDCGTCTPGSSTVFTPAERTGNFSADGPFTGTSAFPLVGENGTTFPAGTSYSAIFPTGHIPTVDLNTVAVNLTNKYVPLPNAGTNLYEFNPVRKQSLNQYVSRVDANVRSKDSIFGYWFIEPNARQVTTPFYGGDLPGFGQTSYARTQQYTLSWTHTFGPTTVNEARFGYQRLYYLAVRPANPILPSAVGFTGINPQNATQAGVPYISVTGLFALGFSQFGPQPRVDQTYQVTDNLSKVTGRHTLKFGFQMRRSQVYNPFFSDNNGNFTFGGAGTYTTGLPGADFLLGIPDSYVQSNGGVINARTQTYYTYAQDQLKLRPNLTLTYGVGWQVDTPITDLFNGGVAINALRPGVQSKVFPTAPTGLLYPGDPGINSAGYNTKWAHFSPRFGFAWSPGSSGKTSVRGGFGIYFNRTEEELTLQNLTDPPFSVTSTGIGDALGSPAFATPYTDINTGRSIPNKFPFSAPKPGTPIDFSSLFGPLTLNV
jgi:hypothetical protein